jgi:hypothetical protein
MTIFYSLETLRVVQLTSISGLAAGKLLLTLPVQSSLVPSPMGLMTIIYCLTTLRLYCRSVGEFAAGNRRHSKSWFRFPSGPMTIFLLFFPRLLLVLKWGFLFNDRKSLTTTGHSPSTGGDSNGHSLTNWHFPSHKTDFTLWTNSPTGLPSVGRLNCCWSSPAQSFLASGFVETFDQDCFSLS